MWWLALACIPGLYLLAALLGSLIPVNRGWKEPAQGITIYVADNGLHSDLILPDAETTLEQVREWMGNDDSFAGLLP